MPGVVQAPERPLVELIYNFARLQCMDRADFVSVLSTESILESMICKTECTVGCLVRFEIWRFS